MTFDEFLARVLDLMPDALVNEDEDGELIISTGLAYTGDGDAPVVPFPMTSASADYLDFRGTNADQA